MFGCEAWWDQDPLETLGIICLGLVAANGHEGFWLVVPSLQEPLPSYPAGPLPNSCLYVIFPPHKDARCRFLYIPGITFETRFQ